MSTHKWIDRICVAAVVLSLLLTLLFMNGEALGLQSAGKVMGYENRLFDASRVHTVDIVMDDWEGFLSTCQSEEYSPCSVVIDGELYKNVGIRGKGNTSLSSVAQMGSSRYSFKVEFDQYDSTKSYHGLDKLSLNNLIQDNTMMKDYLTYQMMNAFGAASPLCSFVYITVNGEDWGLYLAVEGVEDAFLQRSYGSDHGELYKPDSLSFGGGRGNGRDFDMDGLMGSSREESGDAAPRPSQGSSSDQAGSFGRPGGPDRSSSSGSFDPSSMPGGSAPEDPPAGPDGAQQPSAAPSEGAGPGGFDPSSMFGGEFGGGFGGFGGGFGFGSSSDVKLQYIDDDPESYPNLFDNAKTKVSDKDKERLIASLKSLSAYEDLDDVLDVDGVLRYFVVHSFVVNGDSYTGSMIHNYYLYEKDGRLSMIPWDYNLAFGTFQGNDASGAVNDPIDDALSDRPMQGWIFSDEDYTRQYHALYAEFLETVDPARIIADAYGLIADYVEKDPTKFCTYGEFEQGVAALKSFCALRRESVQGQLDGTVPSTAQQQSADRNSLVDAGALVLSDMGTMGGRGAGGSMGPGNMGGGFGRFDGAQGGGDFTPPSGSSDSGSTDGGSSATPPSGNFTPPGGNFTPPSGGNDSGSTDGSGGSDSGSTDSGGNFTPPGGGSFTPPGGGDSGGTDGGGSAGAVLLGGSALVLVLGLAIAFRFRR